MLVGFYCCCNEKLEQTRTKMFTDLMPYFLLNATKKIGNPNLKLKYFSGLQVDAAADPFTSMACG